MTGSQFIRALFIDKNMEKAHALFDDSIGKQVAPEDLKSLEEQLEGQLGGLKNILEVNNEKDTFYFYSDFSKTKLDVQITFNEANKIIGFYFVPHKTFEKKNEGDSKGVK